MSDLLLNNHLRESDSSTVEVRHIARVRTLTVLFGLDPTRKGTLIRFLYDAGLMSVDVDTRKSVIDLSEANLSYAELTRANLIGADLRKADLSGSKLSFARLDEAHFEGANLSEANLTGTQFLEQKSAYYQELYIHPYGEDIVARTYHDGAFALDDPLISYTQRSVYYHGLLTKEKVGALKSEHPQYDQIFNRLYDNYRIIPCSARFKYNLPELMLVIMNKLGPNVFESFKQVVNVDK